MAALYRLAGVRIRYGRKVALDLPALEIPEGRPCVVAGPNGSGKSTLLSLLAFLLPPSEGTLCFDGAPLRWTAADLVHLRRAATLLHQSPYLFDGTVDDNVSFGLRARGIRGADRRVRVEECLETVGLPGFGPRRTRALSGGEAQRVALARALAVRPRVLLLDEPLSGVDRETAPVLRRIIGSLAGAGTTVILATHDPDRPDWGEGSVVRLEEGRTAAPAPGGPGGA